MAKSFKLTISKVINTTLQSCRSKDPADLPEEPVSALFKLSPNSKLITVNFPVDRLPSRMKANHHHHHLRCKSSSSSAENNNIPSASIRSYSGSREFKWQKEEKWHVIARIYGEKQAPPRKQKQPSFSTKNKLVSLPPPPPPPSPPEQPSSSSAKKKRSHRKKKKTLINTPSVEGSGRFSHDGGDERSGEKRRGKETLVTNLSVDSIMEFNSNLEAISDTRRQKRNKKKGKQPSKATTSIEIIHRQSSVSSTTEIGSPARLSKFKKFIPCSVDGKVKESFAIVKKSEDPYEDFKRSMIEMILEKQIFEEEDLEQLLQCFLSLNSSHYRLLILSAFTEIWESMFSATCFHKFISSPLA